MIACPSVPELTFVVRSRVISEPLFNVPGFHVAPEFEYVIINQDFPAALEQLTAIVRATRLRYRKQAARHAEVFSGLGIGPVPPLR